jgi:hypothetical protein
MANQFRFDDAYGKVLELNKEENAYFFLGSYYAYGINADMSDAVKERIVIDDLENNMD